MTASLTSSPLAEVRTYKVEDVLAMAREGRIRIPAFQRPPRWRSRHVIELFESVAQGFPIGTLLFATRDEPPAEIHFGHFAAIAPATRDALVVVDGQQRVSALVGAMLHPARSPRGDVHAIWLDLEAATFVHARGAAPDTWVPLRVLGDSTECLRWMRRWALAEEREDLVTRALDVGKRLREFQLSCAVVRGDDEVRLRRMFHRLNTGGVSMREDEVFAALFGHDPATNLDASSARLSALGFGEVTAEDVRQSLLCVAGLEQSEGASALDAERVRAVLPHAEQALGAALHFLAVDASIPDVGLLPYRLPLRVLARFFDRHPEPSERARTLLRRWLWRGTVAGLFNSSAEGRVRPLQRAVDDRAAEVVAQALLQQVHDEPATRFDTRAETWAVQSARRDIVAVAMLARAPKDPLGAVVSIDDLRHDEPSGDARSLFLDVAQRPRGAIAGRVVLAAPGDIAALAEAPDAVLESQSIPVTARDALRAVVRATDEADRIAAAERFDELRAPTLDAWTEQFVRAQCEFGADDRVSIASLVAPFREARPA